MLLNEYEITEEGIAQFSQDCKSAVTSQQLFEFLATLEPKTWPKFTQKFKDVLGEDFVAWAERNFAPQIDVIKVHIRAMENPVAIIGDLIYQSVKGLGTDDTLLGYVTGIFRDYHWKDLSEAYKEHGDVTKDLKGDLSGKYEDAVLRFWGLVWF